MTLSNDELIRRFIRGRTTGKSCNMEIRELEIDGRNRGTVLIDYGWAILSHRTKRGNHITLFNGWYGYSVTTSTHLNKIRPHVDRIRNEKVQVNNTYNSHTKITKPNEWGKKFPFDTSLERAIEEYT